MKSKKILAAMGFLLVLLGLFAACSSNNSNGGGTGNGGSNSSTYDNMAQSGQSVYSANCARCHGVNGEGNTGPQIVGETNIPLAYPTASQLLNKIKNTMPQDTPGTLTTAQYQQVLCYLLIQNGWVNPQDTFEANNLSNVGLG